MPNVPYWKVGVLADVEGTLEIGATVVAEEIELEETEEEEAERTEFDIEGLLEAVGLDENGNVVSIVVDGLTITVQRITRMKGSLEPGSTVEVSGIVAGETLLARTIKGGERDDDGPVSRNQGEEDQGVNQTREIRMDGLVESVQRDCEGGVVGVTVDGFDVSITDLTDIDGAVEEGAYVKIRAIIDNGVFTATEIDVRGSGDDEAAEVDEDDGADGVSGSCFGWCQHPGGELFLERQILPNERLNLPFVPFGEFGSWTILLNCLTISDTHQHSFMGLRKPELP